MQKAVVSTSFSFTLSAFSRIESMILPVPASSGYFKFTRNLEEKVMKPMGRKMN